MDKQKLLLNEDIHEFDDIEKNFNNFLRKILKFLKEIKRRINHE